ncbi:MAG: hypothetical protein ACLPHP_02720 [Candidatus Sulfotelmatobacter sp.]
MLAQWTFRGNLRWNLILLSAVLGVAQLATAQNAPASAPAPPPQSSTTQSSSSSEAPIAAAARDAKAQKAARAKKVFTDEDMEATAGPLPRLKMDGPENGDDVAAAIAKYKADHTPEQTENAVHIWYDRYDDMLAAAIQTNIDVTVLRQTNYNNGYELCQQSQDYQQCNNRQMAELRGARNDQVELTKNNNLEVRIQHAFMKVRNGLMMNGLRYDWFKIRTTNGIDQF